MPLTITEGDLTFTFSEEAHVIKYDASIHYRNQFKDRCYKDNKAVDFIAYKNDIAWLCEIKDFRQGKRDHKKIPLCDEIAIKVRDTLAGLVSTKLQANDDEKNFAKKVLKCKKINIIFHIEQSPSHPYNLSDLQDKLRQLLKAIDPHVMVVNKANLRPEKVCWNVK